jgi:hypothetical protein
MSWDVFVMDMPDVASVAEVPDDHKPRPLGPRAWVIDRIKEVVPDADFSDPAWGNIEGDYWSIEVNLGKDEECSDFAFHVRGAGEEPVDVIQRILDHLGVRAVDGSSGEFFSREAALASFDQWRAFRDRVAAEHGVPPLPVPPVAPSPAPQPTRKPRGLLRRILGI